MDVIHKFLNIAVPPFTIFSLFLCLPTLYCFKLVLFFLRALFIEDMNGKVVLITDSSSGIGEQLAYQYAKKGAFLALVASSEKSLQEVGERARELGSPDVLVILADVAKADECKRFVEQAVEHFGKLNHLVNNAGIASVCMFEEATDITKFTPVMGVNYWGSVYPTHFALPHLKRSRGKIVVNSSAAGWLPVPRMSFYNASKAALISFYETLRIEFGSDVKITIATPGWTESEMFKGKFLSKEGEMLVDQEIRDVQIGVYPVTNAEECAKAIVNSACRGDRYVTEPSWFGWLFLYKVFAPELLEWFYRIMLVTEPGTSQRDATIKKILDAIGAKKYLYPDTIQSPEVKRD